MTCEFCTDPDGNPCYPIAGLAPHEHTTKGLQFHPRDDWPDNYTPGKDDPYIGLWSCPHCGHGKATAQH
jgi:hypothetical protein